MCLIFCSTLVVILPLSRTISLYYIEDIESLHLTVDQYNNNRASSWRDLDQERNLVHGIKWKRLLLMPIFTA